MPKKVSKIHVWMSGMKKKKPKLDSLLLPKEIEQALPLIPSLYFILFYFIFYILFYFIFMCIFKILESHMETKSCPKAFGEFF
jgi:hypothetical protein